MSPSPPSLLSDVLERWRPPNWSRKDLTSFWMASKRFKNLSDRAFYSYIVIQDVDACLAFAKQLEAWTDASSPIPSLIVGLTLGGISQTCGTLVDGMEPVASIFVCFPNLAHLNLGGQVAATTSVLLAMVTEGPGLRSLVGLGMDAVNCRSVVRAVSLLSKTLENISIVGIESMEVVLSRTTQPSVVLPHLLRLNVVQFDLEDEHNGLLATGWSAPRVRVVLFGMESEKFMGEGQQLRLLIKSVASSLQEVTLPMSYLIQPGLVQSVLKSAVDVRILAFHLSGVAMWLDPVVTEEKEPTSTSSVQSLILVQAPSGTTIDAPMGAAIFAHLSKRFSESAFSSLRRVYYLTEEPNDLIWPVWARLSLDLVKRGIDVIYL